MRVVYNTIPLGASVFSVIKSLAMNRRKGFALVPLVLLIVVVAILIFSTTSFLWQSARLNAINFRKHQALTAAQAGTMKAAYETLQNGTYVSSEAILANQQAYKYAYLNFSASGGQASNNVYIDASGSFIGAGASDKNLYGWTIVNLSTTSAYTITQIQVTWNKSGGRRLTAINLGAGAAEWSGSAASSPYLADITDYILPISSTTIDNTLFFSKSLDASTITLVLYFSDGSTRTDQVYPAVAPTPPGGGGGGIAPTEIKSTGSSESIRQTIVCSFEVSSGALKFKSYNEGPPHL